MGCCNEDNYDPVPTPPPEFADAMAFSYTVTGSEPDLSNLVILLPETRADALYTVQVTPGSFNAILSPAAPVANRTTTQFVLSLSGPATALDTFDFFVMNPTSPADPLAGVARDATSGKYIPANAAQWDIVLAAAGIATGGPVACWPMQDAATPLVDTIGAFDLVAAGAPSYQQAVPGWTSLGVTLVEANANRFSVALAAGNTTSALILYYIAVTATPSQGRQIAQHPNIYAEVTADPFYQANGGTIVTGVVDPGTTVNDVWLRSNFTLSEQSIIANGEVLSPTWFVDAVATISLGSTTNDGPAMTAVYGAAFTGPAAELSLAQIATLRTTLGW